MPAAEPILFSYVLGRVSRVLEGRTSPDSAEQADYVDAIQSAARELILEGHMASFRVEAEVVIEMGKNFFYFPEDLRTVIEPSLVYADSPRDTLEYLPHQIWDRHESDRSFRGTEGKPRRWTMDRMDVTGGFTGQWRTKLDRDSDADYLLRFRYIAWPVRMDNLATTADLDPRFPEAYKHALVSGALIQFPNQLTQLEMQGHSRTFEVAKNQIRRGSNPVLGVQYGREPTRVDSGQARARYRGSYGSTPYVGWQNP